MKYKIQKTILSLLLIAGLPGVAISCEVLFYDAREQTDEIQCMYEVWVGYIYPAQLCYERLANQNAGVAQPELSHSVSQSECDSKVLLALFVHREQCAQTTEAVFDL